MKTILFSISFLLIAFVANAQKDVPEVIQKKFKEQYKNASQSKFSKEADGNWEVDFMVKTTKFSTSYTEKGEWLGIEQNILRSDLPKNVNDIFSNEYKGWRVKECEKVTEPNKESFYEIEIGKKKEILELKIEASGKIIEKKVLQK